MEVRIEYAKSSIFAGKDRAGQNRRGDRDTEREKNPD